MATIDTRKIYGKVIFKGQMQIKLVRAMPNPGALIYINHDAKTL